MFVVLDLCFILIFLTPAATHGHIPSNKLVLLNRHEEEALLLLMLGASKGQNNAKPIPYSAAF
jgi:hypothetical protein